MPGAGVSGIREKGARVGRGVRGGDVGRGVVLTAVCGLLTVVKDGRGRGRMGLGAMRGRAANVVGVGVVGAGVVGAGVVGAGVVGAGEAEARVKRENREGLTEVSGTKVVSRTSSSGKAGSGSS